MFDKPEKPLDDKDIFEEDRHATCTGCCPDCGEHCPEEGGTSCGASRNRI